MNTPPSWVGRTLNGRYQIDKSLGHGGMATVYQATDPNLKRVVAVKMIHPHLATDSQFVRRFKEEATAVAQLRHPNIVQVYDYNSENEIYYIVFEFVAGETLQDRLKRLHDTGRKLSAEEIVKIAVSMCDALDYAHKRGMIHRDVKPANIMLDVHGNAILTDFGIVKIAGATQFTATGATVGTAQYMSPEQIKGEHLDARSDIYSLGVALFEMVGGRRPFESESAMTLMMMHINDPIPDLSQLRPDAPADLLFIIEKALSKNPEWRYQSAAEMMTALKALQAGKPVAAAPLPAAKAPTKKARPAPTTAPAAAPPKTPPPAAAPPPSGKKQLPIPILIAAVVAILFCIGGAIFIPGLFKNEDGNDTLPTGVAVAAVTVSATTPVEAAATTVSTETPAATETAASTETPAATATIAATNTSAADAAPPTATATATQEPTAVATATTAPTHTPTTPPTATTAPTAAPTMTPTAVVGKSVSIASITIDDNGKYVVSYTTSGYTEQLPGEHIHFFFNTVTPANAGAPGSGPWILYGGPRPFTGYGVADRPSSATQMCALVANADHSIQLNSGNCVNLP